MIIIACILGFLACFLAFKLWVVLVKKIGSGLTSVMKPVYRFLLKVLPVTTRLIAIFVVVMVIIFVVSLVKGSDERKNNDTVVEEVTGDLVEGEEKTKNQIDASVEGAELEVKEKQEMNFGEKFIDRALRRGENFTSFLMNAIEANNERLGIGEEGGFKGSTIALFIYTFILFVLLPFMLALVVVLYLIIVMLEPFAILLAIDIVILIVRFVKCDSIIETIKQWWEMSWE